MKSLNEGKDLAKISGDQVYPISQALCWQRTMTDVLYLKLILGWEKAKPRICSILFS